MANEFVWAKRPEPHSTPETMGTICDGCPELSCIKVDSSKLHPWRYYCEKAGRNMTIHQLYLVTSDSCPLGRTIERKWASWD